MSAPTFENLQGKYQELLDTVEIKPNWMDRANAAARKIISGKARYVAVSKALKKHNSSVYIPWQFIGIIHHLEGDCDFGTHLHNGDSLRRRTRNKPAGRPVHGEPPFTFEESAIDALNMRNIFNVPAWTMPRICYELEGYNGWGYIQHHPGVNSPYLWSGSNHYTKGKYVSDGQYDSEAVSQQTGTIVILKRIMALDLAPNDIVKSSTKLSSLQSLRAWLTATFGGYLTLDTLKLIPSQLKEFEALGLNGQQWALVGAAAAIWGIISYVQHKSIMDYSAGNYTPSQMKEIEHDDKVTL